MPDVYGHSLNKPSYIIPTEANKDPVMRVFAMSVKQAFDDVLWQFRHLKYDAALESLALVCDEIWIHKSLVNIDGTDYIMVSHIGPSTGVGSYHTFDVSIPADAVRIAEKEIEYDARGHVTGSVDGQILDIIGDETWVHVDASADEKTNVTTATIEHIGPDVADNAFDSLGASFANGGNSLILSAFILYFDTNGHRTEDPVGDGGTMTVTGDGTWIYLDPTDAADTVIKHLDPSNVATRVITIQGNDTWIVGSGTVDADAKGHVNDTTKTINLTHGGPGGATRIITIDGGDNWIVGSGTVDADSKGHVTDDTKSIHLTHGDPYSTSWNVGMRGHDDWIIIDGAAKDTESKVGFDAKGHNTNGTEGKIISWTHNDPQAATIHDDTLTATVGANSLTITKKVIGFDAKGHRKEIADGASVTFTAKTYIGDEVWIHVDNASSPGVIYHDFGDGVVTATAPGIKINKFTNYFTLLPQTSKYDFYGHFLSYEGPSSYEGDTGSLNVSGDNSWIECVMDGKGSATFTHIGPQDAKFNDQTCTIVVSADHVEITPRIFKFDAKGHRKDVVDGTMVSFPLGGGAAYTADEIWIHLNVGASKFEHMGPGDQDYEEPGVKLTWGTSDGGDSITFTPRKLGFDIWGHNTGATDSGDSMQPYHPLILGGGDNWIVFHGSAGGVNIQHGPPQGAANFYSISSSTLNMTGTVVLGWDAKGHWANNDGSTGTPGDLDLTIDLPDLHGGSKTIDTGGGHSITIDAYGRVTGWT